MSGPPGFGPPQAFPDRCLPDLVADQARRRPEAVAVVQAQQRLTYRELLGQASAVAAALRERGVGADTLVGVCLPRRPPLVAALLGVLAAGAGYVPLDPALPAKRVRAMVAEARLRLIVGPQPRADHDPGFMIGALGGAQLHDHRDLDAFAGVDVVTVPDEPAPHRPGPATPATVAYAMFTSGSTGRPKGVVIEHRALTEIITSAAEFARLDHTSRSLAFSSIGFDASVLDLLAPLAVGGTVVLASDADRADPTRLHRVCADHAVTVTFLPPPLLPVLEPTRLPSLRTVITGGEAPGPEQVARWTADGRRFINVYGPTETTVLVTWFEASGSWTRPLPIGAPAANHRVYLVDSALRGVPRGEPGEVVTGGPGLGRGYLHDPAGTAARFVPDPFSREPGARLYRTGDLARWLPDGTLEFLGRQDRQVKIRGQRIELGEIEAVLRGHPLVSNAAVEARADPAGAELIAYVASAVAPAELRTYCAQRLPAAAVPARLFTVAQLPVTPNGKTDLDRLRAHAAAADAAALVAAGHPGATPSAADRSAADPAAAEVAAAAEQVAQAWAALLARPATSGEADFFDHGGHSITAMRLVTELRARLAREVTIEDVLAGRTLRGIAERVAVAAPIGDDAPVRGRAPALSPAQQRLWFLDRYSPEAAAAYNVAFAERLTGPLDVAALASAFAAVAARQQVLRWRIPDSDGVPYAVVDPPGPVALAVVALPEGADLAAWLAERAARPFRLASDALWRAELVRLGPTEHVLACYAHHAVFDGWSQALLYDDLAAAYAAARGAGPPLPALPATYGDYVAWRAERHRRRGAADLDWWLEHLTGVPVVLELPADGVRRPGEQTFPSASVAARLDPAGTAAMTQLAARLGTTPSAVLLAAFGLALTWQSGQPDLVVGTVTVDRRAADFEQMVGFFIDIAPLRLRCHHEASFAEHVRAARDELLLALAHPEAPLERIVGALGLGGRLDRNPLVQVLFNMYTFAQPSLRLAGLASEPVPIAAPGSPFDLTLYGVARDGRLGIEIVYNPDVYGRARMTAVLDAVQRVLAHGVAEPGRPVGDLSDAVPVRPGAVEQARRTRPGVARAGAITDRPATATERTIAAVWCDVLGRPEVGATDSFFDAGGTSLAIVVVQRQLNRLLGARLRVVDLFRHPTIRSLATHLDATHLDAAHPDAAHLDAAHPDAARRKATASEETALARATSRGAARRERARHRPAAEPGGPEP